MKPTHLNQAAKLSEQPGPPLTRLMEATMIRLNQLLIIIIVILLNNIIMYDNSYGYTCCCDGKTIQTS